jgi:GR25 family glycosyltransferase involved in LPS biosynthesis|tara:strand:- start:197 stop:838 length:642 start_codon:yes stop_codon:yes gene_type:complete
MSAFVITIMQNPKSREVADRCIESGKKNGLPISHFPGFTPEDNLRDILTTEGIATQGFHSEFSNYANVVAAFLGHYHLWKMSVQLNKILFIFEHDAIITNELPNMTFDKVINMGKPSYGNYNTPKTLGVQPLMHKPYFGGAHAYMVAPEGAKLLIEKAKTDAGPTDVFLNVHNFPWLQEYYPWIAEAKDHFTTIQKEKGCLAKHNYNENYEIL